MRFFGNQPRFGIACFAVLCIFCLASAKLNADEPLLVLTIGASTEFELPYAVSEVYQVDEKAITVQFAKKTTLVRIEGQSIGDTSILLLDVYGNYHQTPVRVVSSSTLRSYQWLRQSFSDIPGLVITVESNKARVQGEIFSQRIRQRIIEGARTMGYQNDVRLHPYVYQVLHLPPEPEPLPPPPPPPPPKPKPAGDSKFQMSEFWTSTTYPGGASEEIGDLPFASYLSGVRDKIAGCWRRIMDDAGSLKSGLSATARVQINRSGRISFALIEKSSGIKQFDQKVLAAIDAAGPLPRLPEQLAGDTLTVHYRFSYKGAGSSGTQDK